MATDNYLPPLLTDDAIQALLLSEELPLATIITPIDTSPGYHHTYRIHLSEPFPPGRLVSVKAEPTRSERPETRPMHNRTHSPHSGGRAVWMGPSPSNPNSTGYLAHSPSNGSPSHHASRAGSDDSFVFVEKSPSIPGHTPNDPGRGSQEDIEPAHDNFEHLQIGSDNGS